MYVDEIAVVIVEEVFVVEEIVFALEEGVVLVEELVVVVDVCRQDRFLHHIFRLLLIFVSCKSRTLIQAKMMVLTSEKT